MFWSLTCSEWYGSFNELVTLGCGGYRYFGYKMVVDWNLRIFVILVLSLVNIQAKTSYPPSSPTHTHTIFLFCSFLPFFRMRNTRNCFFFPVFQICRGGGGVALLAKIFSCEMCLNRCFHHKIYVTCWIFVIKVKLFPKSLNIKILANFHENKISIKSSTLTFCG